MEKYLPLHFRSIWDYKNGDTGSIQRATENFNWQYAFESETVNGKVQLLMHILRNFASHK